MHDIRSEVSESEETMTGRRGAGEMNTTNNGLDGGWEITGGQRK